MRFTGIGVRAILGIALLFVAVHFAASDALGQKPQATPKLTATPKGPHPKLISVKFARDMSSVDYEWKLEKETRILTLPLKARNKGTHVTVKKPKAKTALIDIFINKAKATATTPAGTYKLVKRKRTLPAKTDSLSIWILQQDYWKNPSLNPKSFYDAATAIVIGESAGQPPEITPYQSTFLVCPPSMDNHLHDCWQDWFSWDDCYGRGGSCTDRDEAGNTSEVTIYCDCGIPVCEQIRSFITVPIAVYNATTHEMETEDVTREIVKCLCFCRDVIDRTY